MSCPPGCPYWQWPGWHSHESFAWVTDANGNVLRRDGDFYIASFRWQIEPVLGGATVSNKPPLNRDDVLDAHELLQDYSGDIFGLFAHMDSAGSVNEWRLYARCTSHGPITNTVEIGAAQRPSDAAYVICGACLQLGITRKYPPTSVIRITEEGSDEWK